MAKQQAVKWIWCVRGNAHRDPTDCRVHVITGESALHINSIRLQKGRARHEHFSIDVNDHRPFDCRGREPAVVAVLYRHATILHRRYVGDKVREGEAGMKPHRLCEDCDLACLRGPGVCDGCPVYTMLKRDTLQQSIITLLCAVGALIILMVGA
jgi:hypothetical protein